MNESHKEFLRQVQELLEASERRIIACYDRFGRSTDSCLAMGGTASSSSTSAGSDGCGVAEVPAPASLNTDASLVVTVDVEDLAAPTPARCSMEGPSRDSTDLRSASAPATAPATPAATVDLVPVLAAAAASDGTFNGEAIGGVAETPATCSMVCLPRHLLTAPVLVACSPPASTEYVLHVNSILVAAVPPATTGVFSSVLVPTACTPTVQMQQLYNDSELFMPTSSQHVIIKVPIHRPMPWPSFMSSRADGDGTRPLPWPSLACDSGLLPQESCSPSEYSVLCSPYAIWCWEILLLWFQRCLSVIHSVQQANENFEVPPGLALHITGILLNMLVTVSVMNAPPVGYALSFLRTHVVEEEAETAPCICVMLQGEATLFTVSAGRCSLRTLYQGEQYYSCNMFQFEATADDIGGLSRLIWAAECACENKVPGVGICWRVQLSANECAAWICEYLGADITNCVGSWLFVAVCQESVQSSSDYYIAREIVSGNSLILNPRRCSMMVVSNSAFSQLGTAWHVSYDQLFGAFQKVSDWPGKIVTSDQIQVNDACSTWQLFLSGSSISLVLVIILVLAKEPYDTELFFAQLAGAQSIYHICDLQCDEANCGYPAYSTSFASTCEGSVWEGKKLELNNWVSYTAQYTDQCSIGIKTGPHFSGRSTSRALMQGISLTNEGSHRFDAIVLCYMDFPAVYVPIRAGCAPSSICDASYSREIALHMAAIGLLLFLMQGGTRTDLSSLVSYRLWLHNHQVTMQMQIVWSPDIQTICISFLCMFTQRTSQAMLLMLCLNLLVVRLLQTICGVWLLNHQEVMQMLIGRLSCFRASFITYELSTEENPSCCFLCWYYGGLPLFLFMAINIQEVFQGGRCAMTFRIRNLIHDSSNDFLDSNGFKWDPGGAGLLGSSTTTAWGQAVFQGGRGVRVPPCTSTWAGTWAVVMGLGTHQQPATRDQDYKYARHDNGRGIQMDQERTGSISHLPCCSDFSSPIL